jgi:hypothetical protein
MIEDLRVRNFSPTTQRAYIYAVAQFAQHFGKSPELLGPEDLRAYQQHLLSKQLAWTTFNVSVCALRFLYRVTLGKDWVLQHIAYPRPPAETPHHSELGRAPAILRGYSQSQTPCGADDRLRGRPPRLRSRCT